MRLWTAGAAFAALVLISTSCSDTVAPRSLASLRGHLVLDVNGQEAPIHISEFHYDNVGTDAGEAIEISGPAGASLEGWSIVLYNGNGGASYNTRTLSGTIPATCGARGVVVVNYPQDGIQNGSPDGIALVDHGTLVEFLSYEGGMTGVGGPAGGVAATDVGVSEVSSTPIGSSLQLDDSGDWAGPSPNTFGICNGVDAPPAGPIASITIDPAAATVSPNGTQQLTATARDAHHVQVRDASFEWSSDAIDVATVDANGKVTGKAVGTATISATANGVTGTATIAVQLPTPASVTFSTNAPHQVPVGFMKPAFPTVLDASGHAITPTPPVTWSSSDPGIATIDENGYITGVSPGTTFITVRLGELSKTLSFDVIPATAPTTATYRNHLEFGRPADADPSDDIILVHPQFVVDYNPRRGGPNWVSWELNKTQFGDAPRCDCFSPDPLLPSGVTRIVDIDYRNGGYDRGHMAQSEERTTTDQENASTFLLTNVLPQAAQINQGPWGQFEIYLNDLVRDQDKDVYIIAGGIYGLNPKTLKNEGRVAIPDYTWKVALIVEGGQGLADVTTVNKARVIAVEMPNDTAGGATGPLRNAKWQSFQTTVDEIELLTGYDLLAQLPDAIEQPLEADANAPSAVMTGPTSGFEGTPLTFDAYGSTDVDANDVLTYEWDFGDGTTDIGTRPVHTYLDNGIYHVRLTVTDRHGISDEATMNVDVANVAPTVQLTATTATAVSGVPFVVAGSFTDAGVNDGPWSYTFSWGEGDPLSGSTVARSIAASHTYHRVGSYSEALSVKDKDGATGVSEPVQVVVVRQRVSSVALPGVINLNDRGQSGIDVALLSRAGFEPARVDPATVAIGSVRLDTHGQGVPSFHYEDLNSDGTADLVLRFSRTSLIDAGVLTPATTELLVWADLGDGTQIEARAPVLTHVIGKAN